MKTRRLGGALLTLALVLVLAPVMMTGAKAAWATEVKIAGSNDGGGSGSTTLSASNLQVRFTQNGVQRTAWLEFSDGKTILCLTNYQVSSNAAAFFNNSNALAGIYCEGDLEIRLIGDCVFRSKNYSKSYCYGIYVVGNLTIYNYPGYDASLTLDMGQNATTLGEGIRCDGGTLTLERKDSGSLTVTATGCSAQLSRGVYAKTVVMNGGKLIAQGHSQGIFLSQSNAVASTPTHYAGTNFDGSDKQLRRDTTFSGYKYSELDGDTMAVEMNNWTYGDTASELIYTAYAGGTPTVLYTGTISGGASYSNATPPTQAGTYRVTVTYNSPKFVQGGTAFNIEKRGVSVSNSNVSVDNKKYNGYTAASVSSTLSGVLSGDTGQVSAYCTANFDNKNVGTNKTVSLSGWALTGTQAKNYKLTSYPTTAKGTITPKSVTVTGVTATDRYYEAGNKTVSLTGGTVSGKVGSDDVSVSLTNAVGTMTDDSVGTNKPVTVTGVVLSGTDAGNYTLSAQPSGVTVTISAPPISVSSTGTVSGGKLSYTTANVPAGARLIAAWYDTHGKFLGCTVETNVQASGTIRVDTGTGYAYKIFLVNGTTYAPLCGAWDSKNP